MDFYFKTKMSEMKIADGRRRERESHALFSHLDSGDQSCCAFGRKSSSIAYELTKGSWSTTRFKSNGYVTGHVALQSILENTDKTHIKSMDNILATVVFRLGQNIQTLYEHLKKET